MEWFKGLFQLPWGTILISIVVILLAFKFIWELIEWFMKKFKIETGSSKEKKETQKLLTDNLNKLTELSKKSEEQSKRFEGDHKLLLETSEGLKELQQCEKNDIKEFKDNRVHDREQSFEIQKQLTEAIAKVNKNLEDMRKESIDREIAQIRWDILKFSTDISNGKKASRESYDFIEKLYRRYEELLELTGQTNGLVEESVNYIRESYRQKLENGGFK